MFRYKGIYQLGQMLVNSLHTSPAAREQHNPVLQKLLTEFTNVSYIAKVVDREEVKHIDYKEWKTRIMLFKQYGFQDVDCFQMISLYPSLLKIPESNLKSRIQQWVNAELGMRNFQLIFITHPHLLEVNDDEIRKRLPRLRLYFRGVSALSQMIINCPNILYEDWNHLQSKIDYLVKERRFKMGDILKSCALTKNLEFVKLRFDVVEKCGVYKQEYLMPHEENKYKMLNQKNPKLKDILHDKDEHFTKFVAKVTLEEYLAAKDLFFEENKDNFLAEDDDEEEEEEEEEGNDIHDDNEKK